MNNSQWQIADLNEELVQLEKAGAVAQWLPQARFSVGPEVSHQTYLPDTEPLSGYGVSARISISGRLLGGGSRKQYERTLNRRDGQSNQTRQIRAQVEEGIRAEFDQIQQLRNELDVQRKNFERRKLLVSKLVEEDLADEDRNFTAERGAIGNYFAAAQAVVLKKHSILLSSMRLKLLAGTLSSEDLNTFQSFFINHKVILEQFNDDDDDTKFKLLGTPIDEIADVVL